MTLYRANFDYESELFWGRREDWVVEMLEHLFFYCVDPKDTLYTTKKYPDDYSNFLKSALGFRPKISSFGHPVNWWGNLKDLELEKKLNSKMTSFRISKNLNMNHSKSRIIFDIRQLEDFLEEVGDVFVRHPYERAGRISFRINDKNSIEKNKSKFEKIFEKQPLIGDPFFENRSWDLGSCMFQNGQKFEVGFQIKNLNDSLGVFRGAVLLDETIEHESLSQISQAYYDLGARDLMQIDSFSYGEGVNWLCEVNYRKTMGFVVSKLKRLVPPDESIAFLMTPKSWMKYFVTHRQLVDALEDLDGVYPLSPVENPLYCWLISAENRNELLKKSKELWGIVGKEEMEFPSVFDKILPDTSSPEIKQPI